MRLIPNLPDEISLQIFARIPRVHYFSMRFVAHNWKKVLTSDELFDKRKELGMTEEWLYLLMKHEDTKVVWYSIDPLSKNWQKLPQIPNVNSEIETKRGFSSIFPEFVRGWFGRKHLSDELPFGGCSIGTLNGCLYVLGGFLRSRPMNCVYRYDPIINKWQEVASMIVARAYSKISVLNNKLYVIGGVTGGQSGLLPLQSGEFYDPCTNTWCEIPKMPFSKAHLTPTLFMVDVLKPIATGMCTYKERLYVSQSLYSWPFLVDVGGEIYNPESNTWQEMPIGMGEGWPTRQAGTKLSVVVDGDIYALDTNCSPKTMKVYDEKEDAWKVVIEKVPICDFSDSESPYLLANIDGTIHVVAKDENCNVVILQADVGGNSFSFSPDLKTDTVVWNVVTSSDFGSAELVSCQVLDL